MSIRWASGVIPVLASFAIPTGAQAQPVNIDFGTFYSVPASGYGAAARQDGAWNQVGLGVSELLDLDGDPSGFSIDLSAAGDTGSITPEPTDNDGLLLKDNFFSSQGEDWEVEITGLESGPYEVFLYAASNPTVPTGDMDVEGEAVDGIPGDESAELIEGVSWVSVEVAVAEGTLLITGGDVFPIFSGLSGLQVVPAPEPGPNAALLSGIGATLLVSWRRRRARHAAPAS